MTKKLGKTNKIRNEQNKNSALLFDKEGQFCKKKSKKNLIFSHRFRTEKKSI